jgi:hypothetical protein
MSRIILFATLICLAVGPALAEVECRTPMDDWQPVANLRAEAVRLGLTVIKIRADDGCYHVKATDKDGKPVEAVFDPQSLKLLGRSDEDTEGRDKDAPTHGSSD